MKLFDTSLTWNSKPENRFLPSLIEWLNIRMLTNSKDWTDPQRRLMRTADRVYGLWATGISLVLIVGIISGIGIRRNVLAERDQTNATRLVEALVKADTTQVPDIVKQFSDYRKWADPLLKNSLSSAADDSVEKLHLSLALLDQLPAICEALRPSGYRPTRVRPFKVPITLRRDAVTEPHAEREEYNMTCSLLLYRPFIANDSSMSLAKRQAGSAIALLRQGEREKMFRALRVTDDPESLTQFVHRCRARGVSTGELWECVQIVERTRPALRGERNRPSSTPTILVTCGSLKLRNDTVPREHRL